MKRREPDQDLEADQTGLKRGCAKIQSSTKLNREDVIVTPLSTMGYMSVVSAFR